MSFFKDLKEDIAQSVNELTESLDENLTAIPTQTNSASTYSTSGSMWTTTVPGMACRQKRFRN